MVDDITKCTVQNSIMNSAMLAALLLALVLNGTIATRPEPCCLPTKWEGFMPSTRSDHVNSTREFRTSESHGRVFYNSEQARLVFDIENEAMPSVRIIDDCRKGLRYTITKEKNTCWIKNMFESVFHACIPQDATFISTTYVGPPGSVINVDMWQADINELTYTGSITRDGCLPVSLGYHGDYNGVAYVTALYLLNMQLGINDTSVFSVPGNCTQINLG